MIDDGSGRALDSEGLGLVWPIPQMAEARDQSIAREVVQSSVKVNTS